jgi:hypothetical protein
LRILGKVWLRTSTPTKDPAMTATTMNLRKLLEKTADTDFLREMNESMQSCGVCSGFGRLWAHGTRVSGCQS